MTLSCVYEHNGADTLLYCETLPGAYTRGASLDEALAKMPAEAESWLRWAGQELRSPLRIEICQEKASVLQIRDADSDVLFESEKAPLSRAEYDHLKALALRSAADFQALYLSVRDKDTSPLPPRMTFYGSVPRTADQMYAHTKNVNAYYFGEIGIDADNDGTILECRERGFAALEQTQDFLEIPVTEGSWDELWSLRKLLRRFLWHDRIHAKAMYRLACRQNGLESTCNPFCF